MNKWQVVRQDDNGNIFIIQKNLTEKAAEKLVQEYTSKGHKQLYWCEKQ